MIVNRILSEKCKSGTSSIYTHIYADASTIFIYSVDIIMIDVYRRIGFLLIFCYTSTIVSLYNENGNIFGKPYIIKHIWAINFENQSRELGCMVALIDIY